jgi:redox-sensitive bicupin YhaK (pirin superfamily)
MVGDTLVASQRMAILAQDAQADGVVIAAGNGPARALLIAGRPLREPIAQYGPFVSRRSAAR